MESETDASAYGNMGGARRTRVYHDQEPAQLSVELTPAVHCAFFGIAAAPAANGRSNAANEACKKAIKLEDIDYDRAPMGCKLFKQLNRPLKQPAIHSVKVHITY